MNHSIHQRYLCVFSCWVRSQECRTALAPPGGRLSRSAFELHCCSCRSSAAARPCKPQTQEDVEDELSESFHEAWRGFFLKSGLSSEFAPNCALRMWIMMDPGFSDFLTMMMIHSRHYILRSNKTKNTDESSPVDILISKLIHIYNDNFWSVFLLQVWTGCHGLLTPTWYGAAGRAVRHSLLLEKAGFWPSGS